MLNLFRVLSRLAAVAFAGNAAMHNMYLALPTQLALRAKRIVSVYKGPL